MATYRQAAEQLLPTVIQMESGGNPDAVSSKGARGETQIMPATAKNPGFGIKPMRDASRQEYRRFALDYLATMLQRYSGNIPKALAAYNAGPGAVDKYGDVPPYRETQDYVSRGIGLLTGSRGAQAADHPQNFPGEGLQPPGDDEGIDLYDAYGVKPSQTQPGEGVDLYDAYGVKPSNQGVEAAKSIVGDAAKTVLGIGDVQAENQPAVDGYDRDHDPLGKLRFATNSLNKGIAGVGDSIINAPTHLLNLGKAGVGVVLGEMGAPSSWLPELTPTPDVIRHGMESIGAIDPRLNPRDAEERVIDFALQNAAGAAISPGGATTKIPKPDLVREAGGIVSRGLDALADAIPNIGATPLKSGAVGLGAGTVGGFTTESTGSPEVGMLATMLAPVAVPAASAVKRYAADRMPDTKFTDEGRGRIVGQYLLDASDNPENLSTRLRFGAQGALGTDQTTAEAARDYGLASQQRTIAQRPGQVLFPDGRREGISALFALRDAERRAAQVDALHGVAPARNGAAALQEGIRNRVATITDLMSGKAGSAWDQVRDQGKPGSMDVFQGNLRRSIEELLAQRQGVADKANADIGVDVTPEYVGGIVRDTYTGNRNALKTRESAAWESVDPFGDTALTVPIKEAEAVYGKYFGEGSAPASADMRGLMAEMRAIVEREGETVPASVAASSAKSKKGPVDPAVDPLHVAVRKLGGLDISEGGDELKWLRESDLGKPHPVFGPLGRRDGVGDTFDGMAERLHQYGYLDEPTPDALLEALEIEARGGRVYSKGVADSTLEGFYGNKEDPLPGAGGTEKPVKRVPFRTLQNLKSWAGQIAKNAMLGDNRNPKEAEAAGQIRDILDNHIMKSAENADGFAPDQAEQYRNALGLSRERFQTYESGAARKLMEKDRAGIKVEDAKIPDVFLNGSPRDVAKFLEVTKNEPATLQAAENYIATQFRRRVYAPDGTLKRNWENEWLRFNNDMRPVLDAFPELGRRINNAMIERRGASSVVDMMQNGGARYFLSNGDSAKAVRSLIASPQRSAEIAEIEAMTRESPQLSRQFDNALQDYMVESVRNRIYTPMGTLKPGWRSELARVRTELQPILDRFPNAKRIIKEAERLQNSAEVTAQELEKGAAHWLAEKDPHKAVASWLASPNRRAETEGLMKLIRNDDAAKEQLKGAIKDYFLNNRLQGGMPDALGNPVWNRKSAYKFLTDPENRMIMNRVFGKEHMQRMDRITKDFEQSDFVMNSMPKGSPTSQHGMNNAFASGLRYAAGWLFKASGPVGGMVSSMVEAASAPALERLESLKAQALLDPKLAAVLVEKVTPENKRFLDDFLSRLDKQAPRAAATGMIFGENYGRRGIAELMP